jgi:hypothetical protein
MVEENGCAALRTGQVDVERSAARCGEQTMVDHRSIIVVSVAATRLNACSNADLMIWWRRFVNEWALRSAPR